MGKARKIFFVLIRKAVALLIYVNIDFYMRAQYRYLSWIGVNIAAFPKFINNDVYFDGNDYTKVRIGKNVTISREVMFLTHDYSLTTAQAALGIFIDRHEGETFFSEEIVIGDHCFIGARVSLLPGTIIGDCVIIGAGAVVKGTIPSDSIVLGNPCKVIGKTSDWAKQKLKYSRFEVES